MKTIVPCRIKEAKAEPGYRHCLLRTKIELVGVLGNRCVKVQHADGYVIDLQ
jgi:hypothetical protein